MDEPPAAAVPPPCCVCDAQDGKHCTLCKSRHYCSKACQLVDWKRGHKAQCKQLAADFQDRLLDVMMPPKKVKGEPPIFAAPSTKKVITEEPPIDFSPAASSNAAARASALRAKAAAAFSAKAVHDGTSYCRASCTICCDRLPLDSRGKALYICCCNVLCSKCARKSSERDERCPLCRAPPPKSEAESLRRLQKHVDKGNALAQVVLGEAYRGGEMGLEQSHARASEFFALSAAQGHVEALHALGRRHHYGEGVEIDYKTAAKWYRLAAEQGFAQSQANLGVILYDGGHGVTHSQDAAEWFHLAALQGVPDALYNLGKCYAKGHGVPQDMGKAMGCFQGAAALGHAAAAQILELTDPIEARSRANRRN